MILLKNVASTFMHLIIYVSVVFLTALATLSDLTYFSFDDIRSQPAAWWQLLGGFAFGVPMVTFLLARIFTKSWLRGLVWLYVAWLTLAIALAALILKELVYDRYILLSGEALEEILEANSLKELFGFSVTLYAFVAGFLLLFSLQEFSSISREFKEEIASWYVLSDLLHFFEKDEEKAANGTLDANDHANHAAAVGSLAQLAQITLDDKDFRLNPPSVLTRIYKNILKLKANDDNDTAALAAIIEKYCSLKVLLRQREGRRIEPPRMLMVVLWVIASLTIIFTAFVLLTLIPALLQVRSIDGPLYELIFVLAMTLFVLPISLINLTIDDLKNPYRGEWSVDIAGAYRGLVNEVVQRLDDLED